jgi:hypothetical protein
VTGEAGEQPEKHVSTFRPDTAKLAEANGLATPWAEEIVRMIEEATGVVFDVKTLLPWLTGYRRQVMQATANDIALQIANVPITAYPMSTAIHLLDLRASLSSVALQRGAL